MWKWDSYMYKDMDLNVIVLNSALETDTIYNNLS